MIDCERIEDMEYELPENNEEDTDGFTIVSDLQAEYCLKKIKKAVEEHDRLVELAAKEIEELTTQTKALDEKLKSETGYFKMKLFEYFSKVEHKETKTQESYKLLSGSLVFKKPTTKIKRPDDAKLLEILKEADPLENFVEIVKKPKWAEYKKTLTLVGDKVVDEDGDIIEGIELEDVPGEFDVKL